MSLISNSWILVLLWIIVYSDPAISCGGRVTGRKGEIKTPNFPRYYDNNLDCTWAIQVDDSETITIEFLTFNVETSIKPFVACEDTFSVYDGPDTTSPQLITKPCGTKIPGPLHSSGNVLTLTFKSDWKTGRKGVHLKWKVSDKFVLHTEAKTWEEANSVCMNDGGHLAVKTDLNEHLISNLLGDRSDSLWIGEYYTPWIWLKGCYKDSGLNLTSSKSFVETKENEAKVCQYHCQHTVYFGLRRSKCYCLTAEDMDRLQFAHSCYEGKFSCPGNNEETCGGAFSLTVYMNDVCWKNSSTWVAKISKTISGKTCQAWSSNTPHAHLFHDDDMFPDGSEALAGNYCRDPGGRGAPWCFTEDPNMLWQFCDAPPCPGTCWSDPTKYSGHLNVTVHGNECKNWNDHPFPNYYDASQYPDTTVFEASNFCRSPSGYPSLWCFTDDKVYEFCGGPSCFDSAAVEETGKLCRVFWTQGSKFYFKQHDCEEKEYYSCFTTEIWSEFVYRNENDMDNGRRFVKSDLLHARTSCRLANGLSNYKSLFGLSNYIDLRKDVSGTRPRHWLGNVRGKDTTLYKKGDISTPSACKTTRSASGALTTDIQPNCNISLGFICQNVSVLCGGKFYNDSGNISSPGYPDEYEDNEYCEWEIHVSKGRTIVMVFHDIDIEQSNTCSFDYIEVFESHMNSMQRIGQKLCGESSNVSIKSASNYVLIKFMSDKGGHRKGFYLEWTSGAMLAGIVIGTVLAILVVVVVVLLVLVLKRKKERKVGAQTILELEALKSIKPANTPSNSETPEQDYLMPIGAMGQANAADIQTKNTSKTDNYCNKKVDIEDDTHQNVSDDKTKKQTADSEQHLYIEIEDAEQGYGNP